jgi:uncharacterized protein YqiB (DUF1249 family)
MSNEHQNYVKLLTFIPSIQDTNVTETIVLPGLENVTVEVTQRHHMKLVIKLCCGSKGLSSGTIPDPEFTIAMCTEAQTVEVLTYRDRFGFRNVYSDDMMTVSPSTKTELNSFLGQWLTKLLAQVQVLGQ